LPPKPNESPPIFQSPGSWPVKFAGRTDRIVELREDVFAIARCREKGRLPVAAAV